MPENFLIPEVVRTFQKYRNWHKLKKGDKKKAASKALVDRWCSHPMSPRMWRVKCLQPSVCHLSPDPHHYGSLFKNWHLSARSQKHLSELLFQNCQAAPRSSRSRVEVVVVVGLPYVMSFMSTRRSAKPVKKRLGSIQEKLQKSFPTADTLPE